MDNLRINNADILFSDVAKTSNRLIVSKLCFLHAFQEIIRALPEPLLKDNEQVQIIFEFKQNGFSFDLFEPQFLLLSIVIFIVSLGLSKILKRFQGSK